MIYPALNLGVVADVPVGIAGPCLRMHHYRCLLCGLTISGLIAERDRCAECYADAADAFQIEVMSRCLRECEAELAARQLRHPDGVGL